MIGITNAVDNFDELEKLKNKTTTIDAESTDAQYPSAKSIYELVDPIAQNVSDIEAALGGFEVSSNKITDITEDSTDTEYPSGKSVYDLVDPVIEDVSDIKEAISNTSDAVDFISYADMVIALQDPLSPYSTKLRKGQPIFIRYIGIPDLWISSINGVSIPYEFTTLESFLNILNNQNYIDVGIYRLQAIEARIPDQLTDAIDEVKQDVTNLTEFADLFVGGSEGQVLSKKTDDDYDYEWVTKSGGGGSVEYHDFVIDDLVAYKSATQVDHILDASLQDNIGYNRIEQEIKIILYRHDSGEHTPVFRNLPFSFKPSYPFFLPQQVVHEVYLLLDFEGMTTTYPSRALVISDTNQPQIYFEAPVDSSIALRVVGYLNAEYMSQSAIDEVLGMSQMWDEMITGIRIVYSMHETGDDIVAEIVEVE